ncbi:MAG TPA: hypothetical protein IGS17_04405 [Oscillatoriales cyanobacterium M59_W2019_021]|nr:MAG: hypothetical protein D6728_20615 [Cyanobacteria bacterium J055]HIK32481.1 hypothetical protein [Oscillatoriales cyanobacterium M4454_W2019_049]HIK50158.1 hypothetical protein [Oscillatoriales cyanobacterium M59_W2019_021]
MFSQIHRLWRQFLNRSRTLDNEPLNKLSLIVIVAINIFILVNVFAGLDDISRWYLSPSQVYPCYADWNRYQTQTDPAKDDNILRTSIRLDRQNLPSFQETYRQAEEGHLGKVSATCLQYAGNRDKIDTPQNQQIVKTIDLKQEQIAKLEQANNTIRSQYDSTLLEKISGQPREQSINLVGAEKAKQELDRNTQEITKLKTEISQLKVQLKAKPESIEFLQLLKNEAQFKAVETAYKRASFWYPSIQLIFQTIFLVPLIAIALAVNNFAQRRGYGLLALISWHLLVIFLIPLVFKVFEFFQVGALFEFLINLIRTLFGGLVFLVSYFYILLIPILGFGIIKFFQKFVFNPKVQAASRVQKLRCINCAKKLRQNEAYCPHCGYDQYRECPNCHALTYKHLPYCKQCGTSQEVNG